MHMKCITCGTTEEIFIVGNGIENWEYVVIDYRLLYSRKTKKCQSLLGGTTRVGVYSIVGRNYLYHTVCTPCIHLNIV